MSGKYDCDFLIAMDIDDPTMNNDLIRDTIVQMDMSYSRANVDFYYKAHTGLVDCMNTGIASREFDIVMCISDDVIPTQANYDEVLVNCMTEAWPDGDGAIYFPDGYKKGDWATIPVMGRALFMQRGYFFDPYYVSGGGDRDLTLVLKGMNKLKSMSQVLFRHTWKLYGNDETYSRNKGVKRKDWCRYVKRNSEGFYGKAIATIKETA